MNEPVPPSNVNPGGGFFRAVAQTGSARAVALIAGLLRIKIVALVAGPFGLGVVGQFNTFVLTLSHLAGLGLHNGIVKSLSSAVGSGREGEVRPALRTAGSILLVSVAAFGLGALLLRGPLTDWVFESHGQPQWIVYGIAAALLVALATWGRAALIGLKRLGRMSAVYGGAELLTLAALGLLAWRYGLEGILIAFIVGGALSASAFWLAARKAAREYHEEEVLNSPRTLLLRYGAVTLFTGTVSGLTLLLVRRHLIATLGMETQGLFQVGWGLTFHLGGQVLVGIATYALPTLAGGTDAAQNREAWNRILRGSLLLMTPAFGVLIMSRELVIRLLYSSEFLPASAALAVFCIGGLLRVIVWVQGQPILAEARLRAFAGFEVFYNVLFLLLTVLFTAQWGLTGAAWGFAAAYALDGLALALYHRRLTGYQLNAGTLRMVLTSLAAIGLIWTCTLLSAAWLPWVGGFAVLSVWLAVSGGREEVGELWRQVRERRSRR